MAAYRAGTQAAAARIAAGPAYTDRIDLPGSGDGGSATAGDEPPSGPAPEDPYRGGVLPAGAGPDWAPGRAVSGGSVPWRGPAPGSAAVPGAAGYGGSLPGVRAGASIAVPVSKEPEPHDGQPATDSRYDGPTTRLAAERARHTRMQVVGAVTERWAPEQAVPVHEHWQLAPPVGPAADLWALGALLFRAVQGHSPYPEEDVGELVQLVCAEPPALAEECGALRPVVESLLRQDPTERPDFEELRGWLRSLIRTAPEPGIGSRTVTVPPLGHGRGGDPRRLPIIRRRGEMVRRRRAQAPVLVHGGRHKRKAPRGPRSLGRTLVAAVFLLIAGAIAYAVLFMPKAAEEGNGQRRSVLGGSEPQESAQPEPLPSDEGEGGGGDDSGADKSPAPDTSAAANLPSGFEVREDPAGFEIAVGKDWRRLGENDLGQIRYVGGDFELVVVPGRDAVDEFGGDPMGYQQEAEPELEGFREAAWSTASGLRRIDVGQRAMAEGSFSWSDDSGRKVYARNLAMILDGHYHVVLVIGPEDEERGVERFHRAAAETYRPTG